MREIDRITEKSCILLLLKMAWYAGFITKVVRQHSIVFTTKPEQVHLLFSEVSFQRGMLMGIV